jgi:hypothetical protein
LYKLYSIATEPKEKSLFVHERQITRLGKSRLQCHRGIDAVVVPCLRENCAYSWRVPLAAVSASVRRWARAGKLPVAPKVEFSTHF